MAVRCWTVFSPHTNQNKEVKAVDSDVKLEKKGTMPINAKPVDAANLEHPRQA